MSYIYEGEENPFLLMLRTSSVVARGRKSFESAEDHVTGRLWVEHGNSACILCLPWCGHGCEAALLCSTLPPWDR